MLHDPISSLKFICFVFFFLKQNGEKKRENDDKEKATEDDDKEKATEAAAAAQS